jgi:hypothetical protein
MNPTSIEEALRICCGSSTSHGHQVVHPRWHGMADSRVLSPEGSHRAVWSCSSAATPGGRRWSSAETPRSPLL